MASNGVRRNTSQKHRRHRLLEAHPATDVAAERVVARVRGRAGRHEVAHPGQAGERLGVRTERGDIECEKVVIAAGLGSFQPRRLGATA